MIVLFAAVFFVSAIVTVFVARLEHNPPGRPTTSTPVAPATQKTASPAPGAPARRERSDLVPTGKLVGLEVPAELSPFQTAALTAPDHVAHLKTALHRALPPYYAQARACHRSTERSTIEYGFLVRSSSTSANVLSSRFVMVTSGAPLVPDVIACMERALNQPFMMLADRDHPFPEGVEGELPVRITLGAEP